MRPPRMVYVLIGGNGTVWDCDFRRAALEHRLSVDGDPGDRIVRYTLTPALKRPGKRARKLVKCDLGALCPGHASANDRPCNYDPRSYAVGRKRRRAR